MANTPIFGFDYESTDDLPGGTLTGGQTGVHPILAIQVEQAIQTINNSIQADFASINADIAEINNRFAGYILDTDGASSTTTEIFTGASITVPSAQNPTGARFKAQAFAHLSSTVDGDRGDLRIRRGITTTDPLIFSARSPDLEASGLEVSGFSVDDPPPGDVTYGLFIVRAAGSGTVSMSSSTGFQGRMAVEFFDAQGA